jgi:hypothetical protein
VYGADFEKPTVYNFSGDNIYSDYADAASTRCASYDGEHVLVVSRATQPHLLKVSDLKKGEINPILLDLTGVSGGTFSYNMGALSNGHVYLSSLSGAKASPLKIYHWETPDSQPETIANINVGSISGAGNRHGDNASYNIDVYRVGNTDQYLWSGVRIPVTLVNESVGEIYASSIKGEAVAPRIINFNEERYLLVCTAGQGSASTATIALEIYDLSKGATIEEALRKFDEGDNHNPLYQFKLGGSGNGNALAQTDYYIEKDENGKDAKLCVFASRTGSGFVICEFPIKQEEE